MEYTGKLYGEGGIPLMLTASDVDALESMRSRRTSATASRITHRKRRGRLRETTTRTTTSAVG